MNRRDPRLWRPGRPGYEVVPFTLVNVPLEGTTPPLSPDREAAIASVLVSELERMARNPAVPRGLDCSCNGELAGQLDLLPIGPPPEFEDDL